MLLRESGGGFGPSGGGRTNYHHFSSTIILLLFLFHFLFHFHFGGQWMPPENQPVRIPPHFQSMDNSKHPSSILFTKNPDESALPAEILQDSSRFFKILQDSSRFSEIPSEPEANHARIPEIPPKNPCHIKDKRQTEPRRRQRRRRG